MNMRMKGEILTPGMQQGYHTGFSMELCKRELSYCFPCTGKQYVVKNDRMLKKQAIEFIRNRKNHMKVWYRQQILLAVFNPGFTVSILALGTMTVTAGVVTDADMPALITFVNMSAQ
jgi:hypothetical protein